MNKRKVFGFLFISLIITLMLFAFVFAASDTPVVDTTKQGIAQTQTYGDKIINWITTGPSIFQSFPDYFAKLLLMILVGLAVYSVFDVLPIFGKNKGISIAISAIVAILGFMFVSLGDIKYIIANYEALAVTITTIIPLIIVLTFTFQLQREKPEWAWFFNPLIIILFGVYVLGRWFNIFFSTPSNKPVPYLVWIYTITLIILAIWLFIVHVLARLFKRREHEHVTEEAAATLLGAGEENIMTEIKRRLEGGQKLTPAQLTFAKAKNIPINFMNN